MTPCSWRSMHEFGGKDMATLNKSLIALAAFLTFTQAGFAQQGVPEKIKAIVEAEARYAYFSGTVLVAKSDRVIYSGAFGYANRNFQIRNTMQTKFNIGSITIALRGQASCKKSLNR